MSNSTQFVPAQIKNLHVHRPFFFSEQKYWAKDIIFLITEHEQLGMQAWLDAYHGVTSGSEGVLMAGDLTGRSGSIQTAINLELHSMRISSIDVKVSLIFLFYLMLTRSFEKTCQF